MAQWWNNKLFYWYPHKELQLRLKKRIISFQSNSHAIVEFSTSSVFGRPLYKYIYQLFWRFQIFRISTDGSQALLSCSSKFPHAYITQQCTRRVFYFFRKYRHDLSAKIWKLILVQTISERCRVLVSASAFVFLTQLQENTACSLSTVFVENIVCKTGNPANGI